MFWARASGKMNDDWRPFGFRVSKFLVLRSRHFAQDLEPRLSFNQAWINKFVDLVGTKTPNTSIPFLSFKLPGPRCQVTSSSVEPAWDQKPPTMATWPTQNPTDKRDATNCQPTRPSVCTGLLVRCTALCLKMSAIIRVRQIARTGAACLLRESLGWRITKGEVLCTPCVPTLSCAARNTQRISA